MVREEKYKGGEERGREERETRGRGDEKFDVYRKYSY